MSILNDCQFTDITQFTGANLISDEEDIPDSQALYNRNTEFVESQVRIPRRGFSQMWNPAAVITTMYSWVQEQVNRLMYFKTPGTGTGVVVARDLSASTETTVLSGITAIAAIFLGSAYRLYMAFFDGAGKGSAACQVWDGTLTTGVPNVNQAFQGPLVAGSGAGRIVLSGDSPHAGGSMGPGVYYFGIVATGWNGYQTAVGPVGPPNSSWAQFVPLPSNNISSTNDVFYSIVVTPNTTWPSWVQSIQLVTTIQIPLPAITYGFYGPANNLLSLPSGGVRWFLVPGAIATITRNSATPVTLTVNAPDTVILATFPEVTNTLFNLKFAVNGVAPFQPHFILSYNNRNVYITRTLGPDGTSLVATIYISEPYNPQYITEAFHSITLPDQRDCNTAFQLGGVIYFLGESWTYAFYDDKTQPASWPPSQLTSGSIGTPWIRGVASNPANGYAWVADHNGLYYFNGTSYAPLPTSYEQTPDWSRINMAAAGTNADILEVIDDTVNHLVVVKAPLDGATVATHLLVWDYTNGVLPGQVKYCGPWCIGPDATAVSAPVYPIGAAAIVQNYTTRIKELWISCRAAGNVKRIKSIEAGDATTTNPGPLYNDDGAGIDAAYNLLAVSRAADGPCQQVGGAFRIRGAGQINITANSFDQTNPVVMAPIAAADNSMKPGRRWLRLLDKQSEAVSYQVDNGAVAGAFAYFAALRAYWLPWMRER